MKILEETEKSKSLTAEDEGAGGDRQVAKTTEILYASQDSISSVPVYDRGQFVIHPFLTQS